MLSDEVIDSIQILRFFHDKCTSEKSIGMMQVYRVDELAKAIETILNFIEKQQKEIEELKEINNETVTQIYIRCSKKFKDKIKAKIEELEIEQESNREDLKIAIDNLLVQNIDKIANKISINMSIRGILQSLLEKEE